MQLSYIHSGKRFFDLALTVPTLLVLGPVMFVIAILVRIKLGAPIFFAQQRPGQYGKPFTMLKFRTMTDARDDSGRLLPDEERLTTFGLWLRKYSLDELPELINVLRGEMSLVGPRPLLMRYLERYTGEQAQRHDVLPGITGWAQVHGRNLLVWEERFVYDVWYARHASLPLDLTILIMTLVKVLTHEGTVEDANVPDFWGTLGIPVEGPQSLPADITEH
jgi:lipopolysaccharide/colanic/teichoic acid biosynthesis glycosyltransferase